MADVFISYASEDRARVQKLAEALEGRGLDVWWDRDLIAGDDYAAVIERELAAAKIVLVVWTRASVLSAFVRDEASRAREAGRLAPLRFDRVAPPLGFGALHTEDFTAWRGDQNAPQIAALTEIIKARMEGRTPDAALLAQQRRRLNRRFHWIAALTALFLIAGIGAFVSIIRTQKQAVETAEQDTSARLLRLVEQGKLSGAEAVELAKILQSQAFADMETLTDRVPPAIDGAATAEESLAAARDVFYRGVAQLLQDPDPRVRSAALLASDPRTRAEGLDRLWAIAEEGGASAGAIWRALGALLVSSGDARAGQALETARALNPQDRQLWTLLSRHYAMADNAREAKGSALVEQGLAQAAQGEEAAAGKSFEAALPLINAAKRSFVLGQIGDAAAETGDWARAAEHYRRARDAHLKSKDIAALSLESAKLARAYERLGDYGAACEALRHAKHAGAEVDETALNSLCAQAPNSDP